MNFLKKVKDNLNNPRKKSLTLLGVYAVFFIFVFILLGSGNSSTSDYSNYIEEENTDVISSYEYIYKIDDNGTITNVVGTYKNNEDTFNYNGLNYSKKDQMIYLNGESIDGIDFDVDRYKYDKIELLMENSDSKTTYVDSKKIVYNISANEYYTLLNQISNCNIVDCTVINVPITVESDNYISNVIIDLSNYYGYKYNIEINYSNINKIK